METETNHGSEVIFTKKTKEFKFVTTKGIRFQFGECLVLIPEDKKGWEQIKRAVDAYFDA